MVLGGRGQGRCLPAAFAGSPARPEAAGASPARTGTTGSHFSGDIFLAFSTANPGCFAGGFPLGEPTEDDIARIEALPWTRMDDLFAATVQSVEEAILNALVANEEMRGRQGRRVPALPRERVVELLRAAGRIAD